MTVFAYVRYVCIGQSEPWIFETIYLSESKDSACRTLYSLYSEIYRSYGRQTYQMIRFFVSVMTGIEHFVFSTFAWKQDLEFLQFEKVRKWAPMEDSRSRQPNHILLECLKVEDSYLKFFQHVFGYYLLEFRSSISPSDSRSKDYLARFSFSTFEVSNQMMGKHTCTWLSAAYLQERRIRSSWALLLGLMVTLNGGMCVSCMGILTTSIGSSGSSRKSKQYKSLENTINMFFHPTFHPTHTLLPEPNPSCPWNIFFTFSFMYRCGLNRRGSKCSSGFVAIWKWLLMKTVPTWNRYPSYSSSWDSACGTPVRGILGKIRKLSLIVAWMR